MKIRNKKARLIFEGDCLRYADLRYADLLSAKYDKKTKWPSPTMLLLSSWGEVSKDLAILLMAYDASRHPAPELFDEWANGGLCPYVDVKWQRAVNFTEKKELWRPNCKYMHPRPIDLALMLLKEKCAEVAT